MKIKDIITLETSSVNPQNKPESIWHLYSLPSFDEGKRCEQVLGCEIMSNKYLVPSKCILFNKLNVRFKRIWAVFNSDDFTICSTEFLPLVVNEDVADFDFVYHLLHSDQITNYLTAQNTNTSGSHKRIDPTDFLNIDVNLPSIEEQKRIGTILSNIERKIDLNSEINQNLESMAKQLYDYWFVQFDFPNAEGKPYKSSGGKMIWSDTLKREIPIGWDVLNFESLFEIGNGKTIPDSEGLIPAYGGNGIVKYIGESNYDACFVIGRVGANCGSVHYSPIPCWVSDNAIAIKPKNIQNSPYLLNTLKLYDLSQGKGGSSQPLITHAGLKRLLFPFMESVVRQYCDITNLQLSMYYENQNEISTLTKQRDELLPLLMNGQVSVTQLNSDLSHD